MVEHRDSELLAHEMEITCAPSARGDVRLTTHGVEALIEGARALEHAIAARREGEPPPAYARWTVLRPASRFVNAEPCRSAGQRVRRGRGARRCVGVPLHALARADRARSECRSRTRAPARALARSSAQCPDRDRRRRWRSVFCSRAPSIEAHVERRGRRTGWTCTARTSRRRRRLRTPTRARQHRAGATLSHLATTCAWTSSRLDELMRMIGDMVVLRVPARRLAAARRAARCRPPSGARSRSTPRASSASSASCVKASCACGSCRWTRSSAACRSSCAISRAKRGGSVQGRARRARRPRSTSSSSSA